MGLTQTQREVYNYCDNNDYISESVINDFRNRLEQEGNGNSLLFAMEKFRGDSCPNCGVAGAFKWHFLGKLKHPDCGSAWYVDPGTYIGAQLKAVFRTGVVAGGEMSVDAGKRGERGILEAIIGFFCGVTVRLPFALLMIPIQAIVSITQQKPEHNT